MALKVWNGSSWVEATGLKAWNGSTWAAANQASVWNGSSWVQFYSGVQITLNNTYSVSSINFQPFESTASIEFQSDGDIITFSSSDGVSIDQGDWISPKSAAPGSYEIRATLVSGDTPSGTFNTWLPLTSNRTWALTKLGNFPDILQCQLTIEIRLGSTVLDSTTVDLYAEVA